MNAPSANNVTASLRTDQVGDERHALLDSPLLDAHLRTLRLPTFLNNYRKLAQEAAAANLPYERFLLALAEGEVAQRERNQQTRCIRAARFPVLKEFVRL